MVEELAGQMEGGKVAVARLTVFYRDERGMLLAQFINFLVDHLVGDDANLLGRLQAFIIFYLYLGQNLYLRFEDERFAIVQCQLVYARFADHSEIVVGNSAMKRLRQQVAHHLVSYLFLETGPHPRRRGLPQPNAG